MTADLQKQIDELLLQLIDGVISDDGFVRLRRWFDEDAEAAVYFTQFLSDFAAVKTVLGSQVNSANPGLAKDGLDLELWSALAETEKTAPAIPMRRRLSKSTVIVEKQPVEQIPRKINKSLLAVAMTSLAAFLLLAAYVHYNPRTMPPIVGTLTEAVDVKWGANTRAVGIGEDLRIGTLDLLEGVIGFRLDSGAHVIVEGPTKIDFQSVNSLYLHRGSLVATVGREAVGFLVNTPHGKVLDLGTEFAVQVCDANISEIHVFQGEVLFYPEFDVQSIAVTAGHARSVSDDSMVDIVPLRPHSFVRSKELVSRVLARQGKAYHGWKAAMYKWHRDPSLRAHYLFEQNPTSPNESLLNAAPLTAGRLNGLVAPDERSAPTWVQGRWSQKSAVRFERGKNQAILIPADPALSINGPITISAWVYYPDDAQLGGHLISCRNDAQVNFQYSMFDSRYTMVGQRNRFEFLRYHEKGSNWCHSEPFTHEAGRWYHFAVTHDTETVRFYLDGELFEAKPYKTRLNFQETEILLGAMKMDGRYAFKEGDFDGVVDELLIFARQLSEDEIRSIYDVGRPIAE